MLDYLSYFSVTKQFKIIIFFSIVLYSAEWKNGMQSDWNN